MVLSYLVLGIVLIPFYRYQLNPDGVTYISIAQKYLRGEYLDAINGHAYPMISWLLVPLLALKINPLLATKIFNLIVGAIAIINIYLLSRKFALSQKTTVSLLLAAIPAVLSFAYLYITPDMLMSAVILTYILIVTKDRFAENWTDGIIGGVVGSIGYLTKSFFMPFFIVHFPLMCIIRFFSSRGKQSRLKITVNCVVGIGLFVFISGLWASAISTKYGHMTVSSQGPIIFNMISPYPKTVEPFAEPPNKTAISIWEDPREALQSSGWNPLGSLNDFKHWVKVILSNFGENTLYFFTFSPLAFVLCLGCFLYFLKKPGAFPNRSMVILTCLTMLIYGGGYTILLSRERFLWPLFLLFMLLGGYCFDFVLQKRSLSTKATILYVVFALSFLAIPAKHFYENFNNGKNIYFLSKKVSPHIAPGSKIATDSFWFESLYTAYHLQAQIYGSSEGLTLDELKKELDTYAIEYIIAWKQDPLTDESWQKIATVTSHGLAPLKIYRIK